MRLFPVLVVALVLFCVATAEAQCSGGVCPLPRAILRVRVSAEVAKPAVQADTTRRTPLKDPAAVLKNSIHRRHHRR